MRNHAPKTFLTLIIVASSLMTGCGGGGSLGEIGNLMKFLPPGLKLSGGENDLFMTGNESARALLPYEARPSNAEMQARDAGRLYGFIAP